MSGAMFRGTYGPDKEPIDSGFEGVSFTSPAPLAVKEVIELLVSEVKELVSHGEGGSAIGEALTTYLDERLVELSSSLPRDINPKLLSSDVLGILEERGISPLSRIKTPEDGSDVRELELNNSLSLEQRVREVFSMREILSERVGFEISIKSPLISKYFDLSETDYQAELSRLGDHPAVLDDLSRELPLLNDPEILETQAIEIKVKKISVEDALSGSISAAEWRKAVKDSAFRNEVIKVLIPIVVEPVVQGLCKFYSDKHKEDIYSHALVGLDILLRTFNPESSTLVGYTKALLKMRIIDQHREFGPTTRTQNQAKEKLTETREALQQELGFGVSAFSHLVQERLGQSDLEFHKICMAAFRRIVRFTDVIASVEGETSEEGDVASLIESNAPGPEQLLSSEDDFDFILDRLPPKSRIVISNYYGRGETLGEIAQTLPSALPGREKETLTESRACQILNSTIGKLGSDRLIREEFSEFSLRSQRKREFGHFLEQQSGIFAQAATTETLLTYASPQFFSRFISSLTKTCRNFRSELCRNEGGIRFELFDPDATGAFDTFIHRHWPTLDDITPHWGLADLLGVKNSAYSIARRLVDLGFYSTALEDNPEACLGGRGPSRCLVPSVVGVQTARRNLAGLIKREHGLDLDRASQDTRLIPAVNMIIRALKQNGVSDVPEEINQGSRDLAIALVKLRLVSGQITENRKRVDFESYYFDREVVSESDLVCNIQSRAFKYAVGRIFKDLDHVTENRTLSKILDCGRGVTELARRLVEIGAIATDPPEVISLHFKGRISYFFTPEVIGLDKAKENLAKYLNRVCGGNLDNLTDDRFYLLSVVRSLVAADAKLRGLPQPELFHRDMNELAKALIGLEVVSPFLPQNFAFGEDVSRYFKEEIVGKDAVLANRRSPVLGGVLRQLYPNLDLIDRSRVLAGAFGVARSFEEIAMAVIGAGHYERRVPANQSLTKGPALSFYFRADIVGVEAVRENLTLHLQEKGIDQTSKLLGYQPGVASVLNCIREEQTRLGRPGIYNKVEKKVTSVRVALLEEGILAA